MDDSFDNLFTSPWPPIETFLVALVVFHVWLIWSPWRLENPRSWKRVDYLWLGMSLISLTSLVSRTRADMLANYSSYVEHQISFYSEIVSSSLQRETDNLCGLTQALVNAAQDPNDVARDVQSLCVFLKQAGEEIRPLLASGSIIPRHFQGDPQTPVSSKVLMFWSNLDWPIDTYNHFVQERPKVQTAIKPEWVGILTPAVALELIAPFLLAVALALRVTKVTAELKFK